MSRAQAADKRIFSMDFSRFLGLHKDSREIRELLASFTPEPEVVRDPEEEDYSCELLDHGLTFLFDPAGSLLTVFLYSDGEDGAREYPGDLPEGLHFSLGRQEVRQRLGDPAQTAEARTFLGREMLPWDLYERGRHLLQVRYSEDLAQIRRLTLQRAA